ncbi:MAG TPA: fumarylacetoacetate hydrolase family protein [Patescibacteria group bacterium]|nr:fumarylacetoacetate hydrolase family protein [Patescibacteria group bacterium]
MKLCRFHTLDSSERKACAGVVEGNFVHEVSGEWPGAGSRTGRQWQLDRVRLLAPVVPSKIVCLARNYKLHAAEVGKPAPSEPVIFLKAPSAVIGPGDTIEMPPESARVDHEGELAAVIGRRCSRIGPGEEIDSYLAGFCCLNDVTARDLQKKDGHYARSKGYDTFCPLGPVIETGFDWKQARIQTRVNGELRQDGVASDMIFPVDEVVRWISQVMTLLPGDVIATGTPAGISSLAPGDLVEVSIEGIGRLGNPVAARSAR